jgi:Tol biopolymer transport system component
MHTPLLRRWLVLAFIIAAAACDSPTETRSPGIRVVSGGPASDTILSVQAPLLVEVRDLDGKLLAGEPVRFQGSANADYTRFGAMVGPPGTLPQQLAYTAVTDAKGRASVSVRLGIQTGTGLVIISSPALGMQDTVRYTVLPGAADRIDVSPRDTAVYVGRSYAIHASVLDEYGNVRPDSVTFTAGPPTVTLSGATMTGQSIGRGYAVVRSGRLVDTAWASVVPTATLLAFEPRIAYETGGGTRVVQPDRIVSLGADGSGFRVLVEGKTGAEGDLAQPAWSPAGDQIAFVDQSGLKLLDAGGQIRTVFLGGEVMVRQDYPPQFSVDGKWIYFTRGSWGNQQTFWRVHPDGTGAAQVSPAVDWGIEVMPSPDPSGDRIAYQTNRATNSPIDFTIRTLRLSTGEVSAIDVPGSAPHWSPVEDRIAYLDANNQLRTLTPATGATSLVGAGMGAYPSFGWSPDGEWLVIVGSQARPDNWAAVGLNLVNGATGQVLPLKFRHALVQPSWKR